MFQITKRMISLLLVAVLVLSLFAGCGSKSLDPNDAKKLVLKDLGIREAETDSIDYHVTTVDGLACYLLYISAGDHHWQYTVVGATGEILDKIETDHAHSH